MIMYLVEANILAISSWTHLAISVRKTRGLFDDTPLKA
jgi:hypothetical protein